MTTDRYSSSNHHNNKRRAPQDEHENAPDRKRDNRKAQKSRPRHMESQNQNQKQQWNKNKYYNNRRPNGERREAFGHYHQQNYVHSFNIPQTSGPIPLMSLNFAQPSPSFPVKEEYKEEIKPTVAQAVLLSLVKKLQDSGYIKPSTPPTPAPAPKTTDADIWNKAFSFPNIEVRNKDLIDAICTKRPDSCKFCGMNIGSDTKAQSYKDHMDAHVQQNIGRISKSTKAAFRQWYNVPNAPKPTETTKVDEVFEDCISTGRNVKTCSVCCEKLDEYFDHDEDEWRVKNGVEKCGQIVHRECASGVDEFCEVKQDVKQEDYIYIY